MGGVQPPGLQGALSRMLCDALYGHSTETLCEKELSAGAYLLEGKKKVPPQSPKGS